MPCFNLLIKEAVYSGRAAEENQIIALRAYFFDKIRRDKIMFRARPFFIAQQTLLYA